MVAARTKMEAAFEFDDTKKSTKSGPITVNQDILRAVGLVRTLNKPLKILGAGELTAPLFVVADAFTASARAKIEAAGGSVNVLEVPSSPLAALGVTPETAAPEKAARPATAKGDAKGRTSESEAETAASTASRRDRDTITARVPLLSNSSSSTTARAVSAGKSAASTRRWVGMKPASRTEVGATRAGSMAVSTGSAIVMISDGVR